MSNQWPPSQPPYNEGSPPLYQQLPQHPQGPQPSNARWYAVMGALLVAVAGLIAVATNAVAIGGGDEPEVAETLALAQLAQVTEAPQPPPVFEPAGTEGADPFFPLDAQLAGFEQETGQAPTQQAIATGLYGGTAQNTCDPQRLIDYLIANPDKGRAWAHVQGIPFEQIPDYINSLTVRVLAAPTTVLNHGFDPGSGAPYEIVTTLEVGTAVLVDAAGDVRARCYCGNPIKPLPIGHKPPRCLQVPHMVYTEPGGNTRREGAPTDVFLTGRVTTDQAWTEISWGPSDHQTGWTPPANLSRHLCFVVLPPPPGVTPTPTWTPTPTPTWTPGPTPTWTPTPTPTWTPTPTPTWTPGPTPTWTPTPTPTWTPTPTPTFIPAPQPLQINCFITSTRLKVGEQTEFSAFHVPSSIQVSYAFDHGDGTIDRRNPSAAFYNEAGSYDVYVLATVEGEERRQFCGTVTVTANERILLQCSIDNLRPAVGETVTIMGRHQTADPNVRLTIDHGDGFSEEASTSYAVYRSPGDYNVYLSARRGSEEPSTLFCGTVRVSGQHVCSTEGYLNLTQQQAADLATSRSCSWRIVGEPGDSQYRSDRVNFRLNSHGRVDNVTLG